MVEPVECIKTAELRAGIPMGRERVAGGLYAEPVASHVSGAAESLSGHVITAAPVVLFDGKTLNADDPLLFENVVSGGSATYLNSNVVMAVTSNNQYVIRQQLYHNPYFSGKPQHVQGTMFDFDTEAGVVKRIGYFSSTNVAPYNSVLDGYWLEDNGTEKALICSNNGTVTHYIKLSQMDRYDLIADYDWSKFSVFDSSFLWLGGASLRFSMVVNGKFEVIEEINDHAGYKSNLIFKSPNHPFRAEIRSTGGAGSMTFGCCSVGSYGRGDQQGRPIPVYNPTPLSCNVSGTIYALCGIKLDPDHHDRHVVVEAIGGGISSASTDAGMFLLCYEPTLSAPLTWTNKQRVQSGVASAGTTVSNTGTEVFAMPVVNSANSIEIPHNIITVLRIDITHTPKALVLCYIPSTSNQSITGVINGVMY